MLTQYIALAAAISTAYGAVHQGFNYASLNPDTSPRVQSDYESDFATAKTLVGTSGFTSARLYTMIQAGTPNTPISAIPAAINQKTQLLLGLWASAGPDVVNNEIAALTSAISTYGTNFTDLVIGLSVGSEDLYRDSVMGIQSKAGIGAGPDIIAKYIAQVKSAVSQTALKNVPVGHVDTWTAWVNGSNAEVIAACDWIGVDAYPYFQNTMPNNISDAGSLFFDALDRTTAVAGSKDVWVTETGWPVTGPKQNLAVANTANAKSYWDQVACKILGKVNTFWYTLDDASPTMTDPSFGVVSSESNNQPLYDLTCSSEDSSSSSASSSSSTSASASSSSASSRSASGSSTASGSASGATTVSAKSSVTTPDVSSSSFTDAGARPAFTTGVPTGSGSGGSVSSKASGSPTLSASSVSTSDIAPPTSGVSSLSSNSIIIVIGIAAALLSMASL